MKIFEFFYCYVMHHINSTPKRTTTLVVPPNIKIAHKNAKLRRRKNCCRRLF